jgi:STELLO glycosyltransferases
MKRPWQRTVVVVATVLCLLVFAAVATTHSNPATNTRSPYHRGVSTHEAPCDPHVRGSCHTFVVITSVNKPTPQVLAAAEQPNTAVVVVGDLKTPDEMWATHPGLPRNLIYLSMAQQRRLGYRVLKFLPNNSYARKNVGYLYAIQLGARRIYDTDDDNVLLLSLQEAFATDTVRVLSVNRTEWPRTLVNPLPFFGQRSMWPRGYALRHIADTLDDVAVHSAHGRQRVSSTDPLSQLATGRRALATKARLAAAREVNAIVDPGAGTGDAAHPQQSAPVEVHCEPSSAAQVWIRQGLVDGDPDVDAIFRLTRYDHQLREARILFDHDALPLVLGDQLMAPFNSQNTLFEADAFFGLLIPTTTSFRVCDIWRGYWAQALLLHTAGSLAFVRPTAWQQRNAHNLVGDFASERALYDDTEALVEALYAHTCSSTSLERCAVEMAQLMEQRGWWGVRDVQLAEAWFADLAQLSSTPLPPVTAGHRQWKHAERGASAPGGGDDGRANAWTDQQCGGSAPRALPAVQLGDASAWSDTLLVVQLNFGHYEVLPTYVALWGRYFPHMVFYGPEPTPPISERMLAQQRKYRVHTHALDDRGYYGYTALADAAERYPYFDGYLLAHDDAFLALWNLAKLPRTSIWSSFQSVDVSDNWYWTNASLAAAVHVVADEDWAVVDRNGSLASWLQHHPHSVMFTQSDVLYVPSAAVSSFSQAARVFRRHSFFQEAAMAFFHTLIAPQYGIDVNSYSLLTSWNEMRRSSFDFAEEFQPDLHHVVHPVKLSNPRSVAVVTDWLGTYMDERWK